AYSEDTGRGELTHPASMPAGMEDHPALRRYCQHPPITGSNSGMAQAILVTGGAGYVGSHACKALAAAGYLPVAYDNLSRGYRGAVRWGPLVEGDLHDTGRLEAAMRGYRISAVMHFAAFAYVGESVSDPEIYYRNNVGGTLVPAHR